MADAITMPNAASGALHSATSSARLTGNDGDDHRRARCPPRGRVNATPCDASPPGAIRQSVSVRRTWAALRRQTRASQVLGVPQTGQSRMRSPQRRHSLAPSANSAPQCGQVASGGTTPILSLDIRQFLARRHPQELPLHRHRRRRQRRVPCPPRPQLRRHRLRLLRREGELRRVHVQPWHRRRHPDVQHRPRVRVLHHRDPPGHLPVVPRVFL